MMLPETPDPSILSPDGCPSPTLPAREVGDRGFEPHSGLQVSKKQNVSTLLIHKDSLLWGLWGASVTER